MGIESLLQQNVQNAGLAGSDRLARNAMFPQAQMDKTQYAVSSQLPTGAQTINADYDTPTNAYTGLTDRPFAAGGIASIPRYDGEEGSEVVAPASEDNPDLANLLIDEDRYRELNALKASDPKAYNSQLMNELSNTLKTQYNTNSNYEPTWHQLKSLEKTDPAQWHRYQLDWLGHHQGWQIGSNTSERNAAEMPVIQDEIEQARKAGLQDDEIQQILGNSQQSANYQNQQRIANQAAAGGGMFNGIEGLAIPAATMLALGTGQAWALPLINAGISAAQGADPTKIAMNAALSYALPGIAEGLPGGVEALQGINTAKSIYNVAQNPNNPMAAFGAAKNAYNFANSPTFAAKGGLMAGGGIADLGSYSDGGRLLKGPGDGMSDHIPATIGAKQPARLAEGEFVVPADVVSHLGNGSTDAGAKQLYKMMDNIRKARTGNPKQGKQINPDKFTPKG
jgi:hypothetical protein